MKGLTLWVEMKGCEPLKLSMKVCLLEREREKERKKANYVD